MKTILNIKTDKELKQDAQQIAKKIGVPLSTVINSFLKQFVRDEEVIFSAKDYRITPYLSAIAEEAKKDREKDKNIGPFPTAKSMIKSLNN